MSWVRVDDEFPDHEKIRALEHDPRLWADAVALWLAVGCYVSRYGTGGIVPETRLSRLTPLGDRALVVAAELVRVGLWERVDSELSYHDWEHYNHDLQEAKTTRSAKSERQARWRAEKRKKRLQGDAGVDARVDAKASTVDASRVPLRALPVPVPDPHPRDLDLGGGSDPVADARDTTTNRSKVGAGAAHPTATDLQDAADARRDLEQALWVAWSKRYTKHRKGQIPADSDGRAKRAIASTLAAQAEADGRGFDDLLAAVLNGYWTDPWTHGLKNRASLANLLAQLERLVSASRDASPSDDEPDPPDWHPVTHGEPRSARNRAVYDEWVFHGAPADPTWTPPPIPNEARA